MYVHGPFAHAAHPMKCDGIPATFALPPLATFCQHHGRSPFIQLDEAATIYKPHTGTFILFIFTARRRDEPMLCPRPSSCNIDAGFAFALLRMRPFGRSLAF